MKATEQVFAMKILNKWEMLKRAEVRKLSSPFSLLVVYHKSLHYVYYYLYCLALITLYKSIVWFDSIFRRLVSKKSGMYLSMETSDGLRNYIMHFKTMIIFQLNFFKRCSFHISFYLLSLILFF